MYSLDEYPLLPTIKINNAFTQEELDDLKTTILNSPNTKHEDYIHNWEGPNFNKKLSSRAFFDFDKLTKVSELIKSKLPHDISSNTDVQRSFILTSWVPYEIHCDSKWIECAEDEVPYYIFLIALTPCASKTVVLNQLGYYLHFVDYKNDHNKLPVDQQLTEEEFQKDFSHCWPQEREYISVKDEFIWDLGNLIAFDIRLFHLSNDFSKLGVKEKQCISLFTKTKRSNLTTHTG